MMCGVIGMMAIAVLTASGCSIGGLFLKDPNSVAQENWSIEAAPPNLFEALADTGRSMGFDINYWEMRNPPQGQEYWRTVSPPPVDANDARFRSIILSHDHLNGLEATFLGLRNVSGMTFYVWQGGKYIEVYVMADGDLGSGTPDHVMKLLSDFRKKLSEKVGAIAVIQGPPAGGPVTSAPHTSS